MTIDEQLNQIQEIAKLLEKGELPLEEALEKYELGIKLIRECGGQIDKAEKKIQIIENEGGDCDEF